MGSAMSPNSTPTEVFADVDPDPDAVLAEFDADSPDDLGSGVHDPTPADAAVDDTTAAELFADLQAVATADADSSAPGADSPDRPDEGGEDAAPVADLEFEFVGDSDVIVRDDGDVIDSAATDLNAVAADDGPDRTPAESAAVAETTGPDATLESGPVPDPTDDTDATGSTGRVRADSSAETLTVRDGGTELELAGPDPTPTRIDDAAFGIDAADTDR